MKNRLFGSVLFLGVLLASCAKDLGNYTYDNSLEDVKVIVSRTYSVVKEKKDFTITPKIEMKGDKSNLSFSWKMNTENNQKIGEEVSDKETLTLSINPEDPNFKYRYYIRFYVTDNRTGAKAMYPIEVVITKPYQNSWMVMHTMNDHAEVGSIEYLGENMIVTPDVFTKENGYSLTGKPIILGSHQVSTNAGTWLYEAPSQFFIATTNAKESGLYNQSDHLVLFREWEKLIHPDQLPFFSHSDIEIGRGCNYGSMFMSNGKIFRGSSAPIFGMINPGSGFVGDYNIKKFFLGPHVGLGYDALNHRFVHLEMQTDGWNSPDMPTTPPAPNGLLKVANQAGNKADPNNLGMDKEVIQITGGYQYGKTGIAPWQRYAFYAYALNTTGTKSYIYVLHARSMMTPADATDPASLPELYIIDTPKNITKDTRMTGSAAFNNIIFYAAGNKVFKLDFSLTEGNAAMIYQHPNPDAQITDIKLAVEGYTGIYADESEYAVNYGHPFSRSLGVAFNIPNGNKEKGELVILNLNTAGKVDVDGKFPSIQIHEGFGPIKSIAFI